MPRLHSMWTMAPFTFTLLLYWTYVCVCVCVRVCVRACVRACVCVCVCVRAFVIGYYTVGFVAEKPYLERQRSAGRPPQWDRYVRITVELRHADWTRRCHVTRVICIHKHQQRRSTGRLEKRVFIACKYLNIIYKTRTVVTKSRI